MDDQYRGYFKKDYVSDQKKLAQNWELAVGLQAVDGLEPSDYLIQVAKEQISGGISYERVHELLYAHYEQETAEERNERQRECDLVSARIADYLGNHSFSLGPETLRSMHRYLFEGIFDHAGQFRKYNITKKEPILGGRSVVYADYRNVRETLAYDFREEKEYDYRGLCPQKLVRHMAKFISDIWQVHPFMEGNTRTTALFTECYLNSIGYELDNEMFAGHAKYFRNALVRANYADFQKGIYAEHRYLEQFFENLMYQKTHVLRNRDLIIHEIQ